MSPCVALFARDATCEFLPSHGRKGSRFGNEFPGGRAIRRNNAPQRADIAQMPDQCPRIEIRNHRNVVPLEVSLRGFGGTVVRCQLREFADDQAFDVRLAGFFIVAIRADISDVRVGEADNLSRVTWIGKYFLISSETGVKNDFAATTGASTRRTAVKNSPVLERENRAACGDLVQCVLQKISSRCFNRRRQRERTEMIDGPIREHSFAVNILPRHGTEDARIVRAIPMIAHHEITVIGNLHGRIT